VVNVRIPEYKAQIGGGVFFAIFSIILYFIIIPSQIAVTRQQMGVTPRFFPELLAGLLFLFALGLAMSGWRMRDKKNQKEIVFEAKEVKLVLLTLAVISLQTIGFNLIGYLIPAILAIAVCMYMYGQRNWVKIVLISVLVPVGIKYLFSLQMYLP
jgi:hypothetical protein